MVVLVPLKSLETSAVSDTSPYVLLVDDARDGREMLEEYLRFRGFNVVAVDSGEAALAAAFSANPAIVLMDLQMPGITGWDATRRLKAHPSTKDVIVVALSARALSRDEELARQAGCDAYMPKPFDITAVGDLVANVLKHGRAGLNVTTKPRRDTQQKHDARQ